MTDEPIQQGWHLDKRVPIALIVVIAIQTAGAVWWASSTSERLSALELKEISTSDQTGRIIRNETRIEVLAESLTRIENKLDRALRDQLPGPR